MLLDRKIESANIIFSPFCSCNRLNRHIKMIEQSTGHVQENNIVFSEYGGCVCGWQVCVDGKCVWRAGVCGGKVCVEDRYVRRAGV